MRIWDLPPAELCRQHLLGEHRELHAIWTILTEDRRGYRGHPETKRWSGRLRALYARHELLAQEMVRRGFNHASPLDHGLATGAVQQSEFLDSIERQRELLSAKPCPCPLGRA
jgi:hypothetical protein